jgi:hypothetical protein
MVSQVCRDRAGRLRIEWRAEGLGESADIVILVDPVASSITWLAVAQKIAYPDAVPPSRDGEFRVGFPWVAHPPQARNWPMKTEALGERLMEGIEVEGVRVVQTSEDPTPLTAVHETWRCPELHLTLVVEASGPSWKQTAKLQNVERREPDPALFAVPADYTIQGG